MFKWAVLLTGAALLSCAGIQTRSPCHTEQFGLIKVVNNTDEYKDFYMWRVVHDSVLRSYVKVGAPVYRNIEPMVETAVRVHPGMVLVVIDKIQGRRWATVLVVKMCGPPSVIRMKNPVVLKEPIRIRPRVSF